MIFINKESKHYQGLVDSLKYYISQEFNTDPNSRLANEIFLLKELAMETKSDETRQVVEGFLNIIQELRNIKLGIKEVKR